MNPESVLYQDTQAAANLGFVDMRVGPDELNLVGQKLEEGVVLQVNGVPVYVNPESTLYSNTQAGVSLGLNEMRVGPDDLNVIQHRQDVSYLQTDPDLPHSANSGNKGINGGDAVDGLKNDHDFGESMKVGGNPVSFEQR